MSKFRGFKITLPINNLYPKLYVGGWYVFQQPFHYIPMTIGKIVVMDMWNLYLN